ncbi:hypothetical protein [Bdellovibrio bacteriovorus]|uniref:hypothetical protein n=1 Tax=Bdellovibrio TaxID=958 RepID=UPI0035A90E14
MSSTTNHTHSRNNIFAATILFLLVLSTGCAKSGQFPISSIDDSNQSSGVTDPGTDDGNTDNGSTDNGNTNPPPTTTPTPAPEPEPSYKMVPLAWESTKYPERTLWSQHLQKIILNEWSSLLPGANDITNFCPRYNSLDNNERANVWAQLFVAIAKYESAYSPTSRMHETTMGTDPVTRQPVYSEGLLQLSYQDIQWAPWCKFDWSKDKNLSGSDPRKTILDPYLNLDCGVGIMAKQIKSKGSIVVSSGVYWAVIKSGGRYQQISNIQGIVRSLSLCK